MIDWKCPSCGRQGSVVPGLAVKCGGCAAIDRSPIKAPPLVRRVGNYAKALAKWTAAGRPVRDEEEVAALMDICRGCELFNGKVCTHKNCGCPVTRPGVWGNKLRWATESCPIGLWGDDAS